MGCCEKRYEHPKSDLNLFDIKVEFDLGLVKS